jgi:hypothetical protein
MKWYTSSCERPSNRFREALLALVGVEHVLLFDWNPRQRSPLACELVAPAGQLLLGLEQRQARLEMFLGGADSVSSHR